MLDPAALQGLTGLLLCAATQIMDRLLLQRPACFIRRLIMRRRFGQVIKVKPECIADYKKYHANIWPEVNKTIKDCNIENYSIYLKDDYLFAYMEYVGEDFEADMKKMADDPMTQKWWSVVMAFQSPLETRKKGEWWADMEEVYHID